MYQLLRQFLSFPLTWYQHNGLRTNFKFCAILNSYMVDTQAAEVGGDEDFLGKLIQAPLLIGYEEVQY